MDFLKKRLFLISVILLTGALFVLEPVKKGFELRGHLGWVSSHSAAQIIHADASQHFVGYTLEMKADGKTDYQYFDRYPLLFAAFTNLVLTPFEYKPSWWVLFSKYYMLLIHALTVLMTFLITGFFLRDKWSRLSVSLMTFAGFYFISYRSMIHFDQPAIFGMALLFYFICRFEKSGDEKGLILASILSPLMGRGYVSLFVLAAYFGLKIIFPKQNSRKSLFILSLKSFVPGTLICTSFLFFNIYTESRIRSVPISEVSIVKSAFSRLGITKFEDVKREGSVETFTFIKQQSERFSRHLIPFVMGKSLAKILTALLLGFFIFVLLRGNWSKQDKFLLFLLFLSGPLWVFPMKRLTSFHDYTSMYYWASGLAIYICLFSYLEGKKWVPVLSILIVLSSNYQGFRKFSRTTVEVNELAEEWDQVALTLRKYNQKAVKVEGSAGEFHPGRPYILGFYLNRHTISRDSEKLTLSNKPLPLKPLHEGKKLFLYETSEQ